MNKHYCAFWVILLFAIITITATAGATATTHIWAPSTDVQPFLKWHITDDLYLPEKADTAGVRLATVTNIGLTVGVLPFKTVNMEIGVDHKSGYGPLDNNPIYVNAKIGVPEGAFGKYSPAVAVGMFDHGHKTDITNYDVAYGKLAKTFEPLGRLSLGYFSGNKKLLVDEKGKKDNAGVFGAYERTMNEISNKLWLCVDYMGTNSLYGTLNFGASWKFSDNVAVIGGYDIYNNDQLNLPNTFTLQVDIDFDCCRSK